MNTSEYVRSWLAGTVKKTHGGIVPQARGKCFRRSPHPSGSAADTSRSYADGSWSISTGVPRGMLPPIQAVWVPGLQTAVPSGTTTVPLQGMPCARGPEIGHDRCPEGAAVEGGGGLQRGRGGAAAAWIASAASRLVTGYSSGRPCHSDQPNSGESEAQSGISASTTRRATGPPAAAPAGAPGARSPARRRPRPAPAPRAAAARPPSPRGRGRRRRRPAGSSERHLVREQSLAGSATGEDRQNSIASRESPRRPSRRTRRRRQVRSASAGTAACALGPTRRRRRRRSGRRGRR